MEQDLIMFLSNFGAAGIFAGVMFIVYTRTVKQLVARGEAQEKCLNELLDRYDATLRDYIVSRERQVLIETEIFTWLKARNGSH